jgi:hypothetical protein
MSETIVVATSTQAHFGSIQTPQYSWALLL